MAKFNGFTGDYVGLTLKEVNERLLKHGRNELVPEKKNNFLLKIISVLKEPMFLLLFATSFIYFILGEPKDGIIMSVFVILMSGISLFQEWRTDKTLQALKELSAPKVTVIRDGESHDIDSKELTIGDLMMLDEGDKISADGEIVEMFDLGVDESTLTGESDIVWKKIGIDVSSNDIQWKRNFCYAGTTVTQGSAIVRVDKIGVCTEYGKIGMDILSIPPKPTPLEKQLRRLIKISAFIGLGLFVIVSAATFLNTFASDVLLNEKIVHSILSGITLAMAMIPEEFPVILTVFLAMGAWRLARKNSLIRRMPSVETLGAVTVLCVDKTGTLTKNQMTVQQIFNEKNLSSEELMNWAALACEKEPYDPMEKAILEFAGKNGIDKDNLFQYKLLHEYSFSSETKMMGHVWEINGKPNLAAKGSPESILSLCQLSEEQKKTYEIEQHKMASSGYRVIAVAKRADMDDTPPALSDNTLVFLGLIGLEDPPRDAVSRAIKTCEKAGLRVVMITGDNGVTASSIAGKIGILNSEVSITGAQLEAMSDEELRRTVRTVNIFARVMPRHKMRIVKALKDNGEVVAMTGDGVNDAPALKYADIGIAMGKRGTDVAKEASDMVLLDDNFTTIVDSVKDGRRIYDNIKKAVGYVFVIHIPIALMALFAPLFNIPLILFPFHVVLLELIIDPTCSIIFERQPAEKDIMERKPRSPKAPLVGARLLTKAVLQGLMIFAAAFGAYAFMYVNSEPIARSMALAVIVFANLLLVYVNQSEKSFVFGGTSKFKDKVIWYVNAGVLAAILLVVYLPYGNVIAKTAPLSLLQMLIAIGLAAASTLWWEIVKFVRLRKNKSILI